MIAETWDLLALGRVGKKKVEEDHWKSGKTMYTTSNSIKSRMKIIISTFSEVMGKDPKRENLFRKAQWKDGIEAEEYWKYCFFLFLTTLYAFYRSDCRRTENIAC